MLWMLLLADAVVDPIFDAYRDRTSAIVRCEPNRETTDVSVCGKRDADRFRVPFIVHEPGDPRHEGAWQESERLLARTDNCNEMNLFLVGCGFLGLSVGTAGVHGNGVRQLAD